MNTRDYIVIEDIYAAHNYHPLDVVLSRGKGVWGLGMLRGKKIPGLSQWLLCR